MVVSDASLYELERKLREYAESKSGFATRRQKERVLESVFRDFDQDKSGSIDESEFAAAMVRFNVVGANQNVALELFDKYDEDLSGMLNYKEFSGGILGVKQSRHQGSLSAPLIERVKQKILSVAGRNAGIRACTRILKRMDIDGSKSLDYFEFKEGMRKLGLDLSEEDMATIMATFDRDGSGRISTEEFFRALRGRLNRARRKLVQQAYDVLDKNRDGRITLEEIAKVYDTSHHPDIISRREITRGSHF